MEKAFKLQKEAELLEEEWETKVDEYVAANPLDKALPFEALEGSPYTIKEITVNKASQGKPEYQVQHQH